MGFGEHPADSISVNLFWKRRSCLSRERFGFKLCAELSNFSERIFPLTDFNQFIFVWSWQRNASVLHQLLRFSVKSDDMHGVLGVVAVLFLEFGTVNVLLPFLPQQSFHLVVREAEEWFHVPPREEKLRLGGKRSPRITGELKWREQKMQRGRIAFCGESGPFHQRIQADIHILRPIAS